MNSNDSIKFAIESTIFSKTIHYCVLHHDAIPPTKTKDYDMGPEGYDLNLVELIKKKGNVEYYSTGIALKLPYHCDFDIYANESLVNAGYNVAFKTKTKTRIGCDYGQIIVVALTKIDPKADKLKLPAVVQFIPRLSYSIYMKGFNNYGYR